MQLSPTAATMPTKQDKLTILLELQKMYKQGIKDSLALKTVNDSVSNGICNALCSLRIKYGLGFIGLYDIGLNFKSLAQHWFTPVNKGFLWQKTWLLYLRLRCINKAIKNLQV